jgi:hypothetical protein
MRSPVAPSTASKLEEDRSRQIKIALTHHRDGTAAIKDGFIVMSTSAGKRDPKKQGNGREERIPWPVAVGRCWFSRLFDCLQPHWADMAEKAGLSCSRWLYSMCVALLVREQSPASGFKPAVVVAGERRVRRSRISLDASGSGSGVDGKKKNKQLARLR